MSVSVSMRSLVCVLALGGVAALQVHPDSRLSTPRPMLRATTLVAAAAAAEDEGKAGRGRAALSLTALYGPDGRKPSNQLEENGFW